MSQEQGLDGGSRPGSGSPGALVRTGRERRHRHAGGIAGRPPTVTAAPEPIYRPQQDGIPLRPLTIGDLLDGTFTTIRRNPRATVGLAAAAGDPPAAAVGARSSWSPTGCRRSAASRTRRSRCRRSAGSAGIVGTLLAAVVGAVLTGMLVVVVSEDVLGRRVTRRRGLAADPAAAGRAGGRGRRSPGSLPYVGLLFLLIPGADPVGGLGADHAGAGAGGHRPVRGAAPVLAAGLAQPGPGVVGAHAVGAHRPPDELPDRGAVRRRPVWSSRSPPARTTTAGPSSPSWSLVLGRPRRHRRRDDHRAVPGRRPGAALHRPADAGRGTRPGAAPAAAHGRRAAVRRPARTRAARHDLVRGLAARIAAAVPVDRDEARRAAQRRAVQGRLPPERARADRPGDQQGLRLGHAGCSTGSSARPRAGRSACSSLLALVVAVAGVVIWRTGPVRRGARTARR